MNRGKRFKITILFCILLLINYQLKMKVSALSNEYPMVLDDTLHMETNNEKYCISEYIEENELECVNDEKDELVESILTDNDTSISKTAKTNQFVLGEPFVIYYPDIVQPSVHYYPVVYNNKIVYTLDVVYTNNGTSYGISEEFVDLLNDINYLDKPAVLYYCNGKIFAENEDNKIDEGIYLSLNYKEKDENIQKEFYKKTYKEKCKIICNNFNNFQKVDVQSVKEKKTDFLSEKYQAEVVRTLHNPMGQYDKGMCWAAAAATIINYHHHKAVTAYDICNSMGINYSAGGSIYDIQNALKKNSLDDYNKSVNGAVSWDVIQRNINSTFLLAAGGYDETYGTRHVVTIIGYNTENGKYKIWNSANNNGAGGYGSRTYNTGICSVVAGIPYTWVSTLYAC